MSYEVFAAWVPGLPHLLHSQRSEAWSRLADGMDGLREQLEAFRPEVLVLYSTQWLSVLGTSFQTHPNPQGVHVDDNWYDWGDLEFNFRVNSELGTRFADEVRQAGLPAKTVNFDSFPIDTGSIVAQKFLNPDGKLPVSLVSSWVYADAEKATSIGRSQREVCQREDLRTAFVACSLLSAKYTPNEIDPQRDAVDPDSDRWNRKVLNLIEAGDLAGVKRLCPEYLSSTTVDMQLNAFHWLSGILGERANTRVHAYGPVWGTGAAVVQFTPSD